ncbi:hypothetical protein OPT61_g5840 [Boeremia exigua]|uniref:Uncharacterized protein n=1 Tax=Boeremia exigua TaxID=749465 RepID=A0ACC2I901_9PLEO|nr:hypothetical protein OPT61_g5840 [Boeremia exigua]
MVFSQLRCFNLRLGLGCLLIAISSFNYGFDNQAFATTQAMDAFDKQFGVYNPKSKTWVLEPYWLSLFNSLNYIGFAFGSHISSRYGRRVCMFAMSCYALVTATISVTSQNRDQIMAARILNYIYVGMELAVVPAFQSEIVPASARGFIVGTYQLSLSFGGLVINSVCRGTSGIQDNRAWRIPLGLFYIVPTIVLSLIFFTPESPRWLLRQGRTEAAHENLRKLRVGRFTDEQIELEFRELQAALRSEEAFESGKFSEVFKGVNLKRTTLVILVNFFQQATGQAFASQYGTIYIKSLQTINPFNMSLITSAINICSVIFCLLIVDKVGRRPLLLAGSAIQTCGLLTMGALGTPNTITYPLKIGIVSMLAVMIVGFGIGWAPLTYVVTAELPAIKLRDHTLRLGFFVNVAMNFVVNFSIPYLLNARYANLQSKVGFIFGTFAFLCFVFTYFCIPECTGKTLEQVDYLFHNNIPLRKFGTADVPTFEQRETMEDDIEKNEVIIPAKMTV